MFKVRRFVCLALVCAMVGVAYGGARKIRSFTTFDESAEADGMAILNLHDGTGHEVQLMVTGFTPDTEYVVNLYEPLFPGNEPEEGTFTTNGVGNGTFHRDIQTGYLWPCLRIYYCEPGENPVCELRAEGCVGS